MQLRVESGGASLDEARSILDDAWGELQRSPYTQFKIDALTTRLPDVSFVEAERRSKVGNSLLERLAALNLRTLPHDMALSLRLVQFRARAWSSEAKWYWTVIDPLGKGLFGLFLPTSYCGGYLLNFVHNQLAAARPRKLPDADRYLSFLRDYARLIDQFTARTEGQAARGIRMPKVQVVQARALMAAFKSRVTTQLAIRPETNAGAWAIDLAREVDDCLRGLVQPAYNRALDGLSDRYFEQAPETVGLGQYPGGADIYRALVKLHTTLDLPPELVHVRGLERLREIEIGMRSIESQLGFHGDRAGFTAHLNGDPYWHADTVEGVTAMFERYIDRVKPKLNEFFSSVPRAPCCVAPLPESLQASMTYGYYDPPNMHRSEGRYLFNAANLTKRSLFHLGALTYHELIPGHHMQQGIQLENLTLHPFRVHSFVNAYSEGWAEYAATWAGEIGLYETPQERYGRLAMDAFFTSRLVVDTGLNAMAWSLERARDYMREHSGLTEPEIFTESVRYSCDIPGQALAYKLGDSRILAMREHMRRALGDRFALKDFHTAILGTGALPLPDLQWHVCYEIEKVTTNRPA